MLTTKKDLWYNIFINNMKNDLKLKVKSVYLIDNEKKEELSSLIDKIEDLDLLMETEIKIDKLLKKVWQISIMLLDWADKNVINQFYDNLKELIKFTFVKKNVPELLDLKEIEINL